MEQGQPAPEATVLVEDQISAIRLAQEGVDSISLMGTHLPEESAAYIRQITGSLIICLDKDATLVAYEHRKTYSLMFNRLTVLPLQRDIKDMTNEELTEWIQKLPELR